MRLIIGIAFLIFHSVLGEGTPPSQNILNGADTVLGEYPYMAGLRRYNQDIYCGGVLISEQHVLTAAHCAAITPLEDISVLLGTNDLLNGGTYYDVSKKTISDDYDVKVEKAIGVAVLTLKEKVTFTSSLSKVALPESNAPDGAEATLTGYGYQEKDLENGYMSQILQKLPVNIVNQDKCAKQLEKFTVLQPQHLCGYTAFNYGACYGDSGSPLVFGNKLIGLALSVYPDCAEGNPDVYARITSYLPFIRETIA